MPGRLAAARLFPAHLSDVYFRGLVAAFSSDRGADAGAPGRNISTLRPNWPIELARAVCFMLDPKIRVRPPKLTVEEDRAGDDSGRNAHP